MANSGGLFTMGQLSHPLLCIEHALTYQNKKDLEHPSIPEITINILDRYPSNNLKLFPAFVQA